MNDLRQLATFLADQPLLVLAMAAIFVTVAGGMIRRHLPRLGGAVRAVGNLGLMAAMLLTIAQVARMTNNADFSLPSIGMPRQTVAGAATRVAMSGDGHFWIDARVNGVSTRFMVDTGATLTALSPKAASTADLRVNPMRGSMILRTANGPVRADVVTIDELSFGNIVARDLDAVVAPGLGDTNVIGMNLLSRLASWRVEGRVLLLEPKHPQPDLTDIRSGTPSVAASGPTRAG